jgi:hypothetical protein
LWLFRKALASGGRFFVKKTPQKTLYKIINFLGAWRAFYKKFPKTFENMA